YKRFSQNQQIRAFVQGVTAAATGAIAGAVFVLAKHSIHDAWTAAIAIATFLVLMKWKVPEPVVILVSGLLGLAIHLRYGRVSTCRPCDYDSGLPLTSCACSSRALKNTALARAMTTSAPPKVQTMVAPVGVS